MTPPTSTMLSTIMKTRSSIPFLRQAAKTALKVDVNRHCVVDMALRNNNSQCIKESLMEFAAMSHQPNLRAVFQNVVDDSASSVIFSWPDDGSPATARQHKEVLQKLQGALRECHPDITTTKPFFMLDGGGRRMASLSVLNKQDSRAIVENDLGSYLANGSSGHFHETPGMWLRHYCSLRSSAST